uniref:Alpha-1,3-mannosyl-glycoprotein 2-beta-N-acetylglucosaminyltransferase n=2 Tax=Globodera pallida TaxID=36090 RepID=A0A183C1Y3_GLOPA
MRLKRMYSFMFILALLSFSFMSFLLVAKMKQSKLVEYGHDAIIIMDKKSNKVETNETTASELLGECEIPVLVIAAKRAKAIENHLNQLIRLRPSSAQFPIIVSQDGNDLSVTDAIEKFVQTAENVQLIRHNHSTDFTKTSAYVRISQHYKFALSQVFIEMGFKTIWTLPTTFSLIFLLSDICYLKIRPFGNPSIIDWTNGQDKLWRTDFFPGLGWMLAAETWRELAEKWPDAYWDDWLRRPDIRKNRVCIRPEQSRTLHNLQVAGKGSSGALFKGFLSSIRLPEKRIDFGQMNVAFLRKSAFDRWLSAELSSSIEIPLQIVLQNSIGNLSILLESKERKKSLSVIYKDPREFRQLSKKFNLMADIRSGMARTAYYGVVPFYQEGIQLFAVHKSLDWANDFGVRNSSDIYLSEWDLKSKFLDFAETFCVPIRWTGKCNPYDPKMRAWFMTKGWTKRLEAWLPMTVF